MSTTASSFSFGQIISGVRYKILSLPTHTEFSVRVSLDTFLFCQLSEAIKSGTSLPSNQIPFLCQNSHLVNNLPDLKRQIPNSTLSPYPPIY